MSNKVGIVGLCSVVVLGFCLADAYVDDIKQRNTIRLLKERIEEQQEEILKMERIIKRNKEERHLLKNKLNTLIEKNVHHFGNVVINKQEEK